ncbi:hypothetical protein MKZ25_16475 [Solibacillus sp. FSL W7-1464]|uniref:hypothetical protein n=1 Tax=Solibacillus sp. FSL W7-1464 TaxID=2921706 RepID=UPI0030F8D67B
MSSSLTWMSTDAFLKRESENPIKLKLFGRDIPRIQKTIDSFHQKYPTPEFWLQNSKEPLENETIEYILVWFLENEFISTTDKIKIFNILFESYTHYKRTIRWAYYYNL